MILVISQLAFVSFAGEKIKDKDIIYQNVVSDEIIEENFENKLKEVVAELIGNTRYYGYDYETEIVDTEVAVFESCLDGNSPGGTQFPSGSGFIYSKTDGTSVSTTVQFPSPFNIVSVSASLGRVGISGYFIDVDNNTDYFKLYGRKEYIVKAYNVWKIDTVTGERILDSRGTLSEFWRDAYWCEAE